MLVSDVEMQTHYDGFFEEVFIELESKVNSLQCYFYFSIDICIYCMNML